MEKINQMKITKNQLKQIIKEELAGVLAEAGTRAPWDTPEKARLKLDQILKDTEPKPTNGTTGKKRLVYTHNSTHYGLQRGVIWRIMIILPGMVLQNTSSLLLLPQHLQRPDPHSGYM